jgi:hypothetical protein
LYEADLTDDEFDKLRGDCHPGCKVRIYWDKSTDVEYDEGYVFVGPDMWPDEGDCFVHIPNPENPGGIGHPGEEFAYMIDLMKNKLVTKIVCK